MPLTCSIHCFGFLERYIAPFFNGNIHSHAAENWSSAYWIPVEKMQALCKEKMQANRPQKANSWSCSFKPGLSGGLLRPNFRNLEIINPHFRNHRFKLVDLKKFSWPFGLFGPHLKFVGLKIFVSPFSFSWPFYAEKVSSKEKYYSIFFGNTFANFL